MPALRVQIPQAEIAPEPRDVPALRAAEQHQALEDESDGSLLGSDISHSEFEDPVADHIIVAQFQRMKTPNREPWTVKFENVVAKIHGREFVFRGGTGKFKFK